MVVTVIVAALAAGADKRGCTCGFCTLKLHGLKFFGLSLQKSAQTIHAEMSENLASNLPELSLKNIYNVVAAESGHNLAVGNAGP